MKYIDSEKLIAEIKFAKSVYDNPKRVIFGVADGFRQDGRAAMCDDILKQITSLQQEQPNAYYNAMLEVKAYVDKLYNNASIGLNEYDSGLYNGIAETCMKLRGFIKARTSREPQDVDLEKEFHRWLSKEKEEWGGEIPPYGEYGLFHIARHFFELGLNARKQ